MAVLRVNVKEARFIIDDMTTEVYVLWADEGTPRKTMVGIAGWHHKSFPITLSLIDIMELWRDSKEDPLLWERLTPPGVISV